MNNETQQTQPLEPVQKHVPSYSPPSWAMDRDAFEAKVVPTHDTQEGETQTATQGDKQETTETPAVASTTTEGEEFVVTPGDENEPAETAQGHKRDRSFNGRIKELTDAVKAKEDEARRLEAQAAYWRGQAEAKAAPSAETPSAPTTNPESSNYGEVGTTSENGPDPADAKYITEAGDFDAFAFQKDMVEHSKRLVSEEVRRTIERERAAEEEKRVLNDSASREQAFLAANPDFATTANRLNIELVDPQGRPKGPQAQDIIRLLKKWDNGPAVAHYLGANPSEIGPILYSPNPLVLAERLSNIRTIVGIQEAKASLPKQLPPDDPAKPLLADLARGVAQTKAPPPLPQQMGGAGNQSESLDAYATEDMHEFLRRKGYHRSKGR